MPWVFSSDVSEFYISLLSLVKALLGLKLLVTFSVRDCLFVELLFQNKITAESYL